MAVFDLLTDPTARGPRRVADGMVGTGTLVVIATYNERENITPLVAQILEHAPASHVLVIDDSSPDGTAAAVKQIATADDRVALVERPAKLGLGTAYLAGFNYALTRDYQRVVTMDADFSHDPKHLPAVLAAADEPGVDLVIGARYVAGGGVVGWPLHRRVLSLGANAFARTLLGIEAHDCTGAYRCYSRKLVSELELDAVISHGYSALIELLWHTQRAGYRIREVPITYVDREHGQSKVSQSEILRGLTTVLRLRLRPPTVGIQHAEPGGTVSSPKVGDVELSVIVPLVTGRESIALLLPGLRRELERLGVNYEIIVFAERTDTQTKALSAEYGVRLLDSGREYGPALQQAFAEAHGSYLMTLDADVSRVPDFIEKLWQQRLDAEIGIASRYVRGGHARMSRSRRFLSRLLNGVFSRGLSLRIRDMSSANRLYRADLVRGKDYKARGLDILQEILVRAYMDGWRVQEIPFDYAPRARGGTASRLFGFGWTYMKTLGSLWKVRNSILSADYDDRAHDSIIPLQRYWQRQRYKHITELIAGQGPVLDVGCGSSRIIGALPEGSVGVDILLRKLRYGRKFGKPLVQASGFALPFPDESFSCVLCSQVIEHVPKESPILDELVRVLAPGGRLVLGTPDYSRWEWVWIEKAYARFAPGAYADEHIAHYTYDELVRLFAARGFELEGSRYILHGELILALRKGSAPATAMVR